MTITLMYAGVLAIGFVLLSGRVVQKRTSGKINLGDGGDPEMLRRIRGHANFAEYVPLALVLIGLLEHSRLAPWAIHALGASLVMARALHGIALSYTEKWFIGRFVGTLLTFTILAVAGITAVVRGVQSLL